MTIRNITKAATLCSNGLNACSFRQRLTGLLTRRFSDTFDGMIFFRCNSIHTFGMRFPIDVIFVSAKNEIISVHSNVKPWKILFEAVKYCTVIELPQGKAAETRCATGDILDFTL